MIHMSAKQMQAGKEEKMKLGMVFEGGASRTSFSCGVMDLFLEEKLMPDYFIGVSAGIAFGVSYLSQQKGRNLKLLEEYMADKRYMGIRHLLDRKKKSFYNIEFVFDELPNKLLPFDYNAFADYEGTVEAAVTNIHTGKVEYLEVPRNREMKDTLVASCSLPVLFQPVKIGNHYYLDGGITDSVPYRHAMEEGCDKIIVVLTRKREYVKKKEKSGWIVNRVCKKYPKVVEAMENRPEYYNQQMKELKELEKEGKIFVIAPKDTFGVGRTESDPVKLRRLYDAGYRIAGEQMQALREYLESK